MKIKNILLITLLASPFVVVASDKKNEKIRLFSDAFEINNSDKSKKRKLQQLLIAKNRNENLPICTMPGDCWAIVTKYLPFHEKLSLRLVSSYFQSLFYESDINGNREAPSIRLKMLTLPSFSADDTKALQQKKHIADFIEKTRLKILKVPHSQDFILPGNEKIWPSLKKIAFGSSSITDTQLNIIFSHCPNVESLDLTDCTGINFGLFFDTYKTLLYGISENHPDFKILSEVSKINAMPEPQRSVEITTIFKTIPQAAAYFSILGWDKVKHLKYLEISGTNLHAQGLQNILDNCHDLRTLNANECGLLLLGDLNGNEIVNTSSALNTQEMLPVSFRERLTKEHVAELSLFITNQIAILTFTPRELRSEFIRNILRTQLMFFNYFVDLNWSMAKEIRILNLKRNFITGPGLQKILSSCPKLESLDLRDCRGLSLENLDWSNVKELTTLTIKGAMNVSNKDLENIGLCCPKLTKLVLSNPMREVNDKEADFDWTTGVDWTIFKNLTTLDLDNNRLISNEGFKKIKNCCPKLKSLQGLICGDVDSKIVLDTLDLSLFKDLTALKLIIEGTDIAMRPESLHYILDNCSFKELTLLIDLFPHGGFNWNKLGESLETLRVHGASLEHNDLQQIIQGCTNLKLLNLAWSCGGNLTLKNIDWSPLAETLIELNLSHNPVTKEGLQPILDNCINLKIFKLKGIEDIDLTSLNWGNLKNLNYLDLAESKISLNGLLSILESCPLIEYLGIGKYNNFGLKESYEGGPEVFIALKNLLIERIKKQKIENPDNKKNKKDPREIEEK